MEEKKLSDVEIVVETARRYLGNRFSRALLKLIVKRDKEGITRLEKGLIKYTGETIKVNWWVSETVKIAFNKIARTFGVSKKSLRESLKKPIVRRGIVNVLEGIAYFGVQTPQTIAAPFLVVWNFTKMCNLKCKHCYENAGSKPALDELTTEEAKGIIDEFKKEGVVAIAFSGGEPLTRKDFFEIAKYASDNNFYVSVATNGTLITPEIAEKLKKSGVEYVEVSLDGFEKTHDEFRGVKGAWKRTIQGIKNAKEAGLDTGVATTITKYNLKEIPKFLDFLEREVHPRRFIHFNFIPTGRGKEIIKADLSPDEREKLLEFLYAKLIDRNFHMDVLSTAPQYAVTSVNFFEKFGGPVVATHFINQKAADMLKGKAKTLAPFLGGCGAARLYMALEPNGDVKPCVFIPIVVGNLRKQSLREIWLNSPIFKKIREREKFQERCKSCFYRDICGGCRARAYGYFGDLQAPDPGCLINQEYWNKLKEK